MPLQFKRHDCGKARSSSRAARELLQVSLPTHLATASLYTRIPLAQLAVWSVRPTGVRGAQAQVCVVGCRLANHEASSRRDGLGGVW